MGFAWNNFGILADSNEDDRYLYIYNQNGEWRKISKSKYSPAIPNLKAKIETLKGKPILFRTSQNTATWSTTEWFSDINIDKVGFQEPLKIVPFSKPEFSEGAEPAPTSNKDLLITISELNAEMAEQKKIHSEEMAEQKKIHSEEIEDLKEKHNAVAAQNAEIIVDNAKLISQLNEDHDAQTDAVKIRNEADAAELKKHLKIGNIYDAIVKGHPANELTLRIGQILDDRQTKVSLRITKFENRNNYQVSLMQFIGVEAIASLGFNDDNRLIVKSFRSIDPDYFDKFEKSEGVPEKFVKDKVMTPEERLEIHNRVKNTKLV